MCKKRVYGNEKMDLPCVFLECARSLHITLLVASNDIFISSFPMGTVGKHGRILCVVIFIFNIIYKNVSYVFVKFIQWGTTT